jgi:serine/threonine protein kinase
MERVGMGSYGQVYTVASHRYEGMIFVAKVIRIPEAPDNQISRELFNREVTILRTLDHPHIVSFFDSFPCGEDFVLILEYCDHGTIDRYIRAEALSQTDILRLLKQVLMALQDCHRVGIAHRDIKPANILVDKYNRAKLVDFGLSCFVRAGDKSRAGSRTYMAPELVRNIDGCDLFKADIWSLGVTFYTILVGESPWPRVPGRMRESSDRISAADFLKFPDTLDVPVKTFLSRMICLVPSKRPPVDELLKDPVFMDQPVKPLGTVLTKSISLRFPSKSAASARATSRKQVRVVRAGIRFVIPSEQTTATPTTSRKITTPVVGRHLEE